MMQIEKARAFYLPDGSYLKVETFGDENGGARIKENGWRSMDVRLIRPDGKDALICAVEYDREKGLRTLLFDEEHDEPIYERVALPPKEEA